MEDIEALLSKAEPKVRSWLVRSIALFLGTLLPTLLILLPTEVSTTLIVLLFAIYTAGILWVLTLWARRGEEIRQLESEILRIQDEAEHIDEQEFSILCMIVDSPGHVENSHIRERLSLSESDLHCSLKKLFDLKFIEPGSDTLKGPYGYWPSSLGCRYIKHHRRQNQTVERMT